MKKALVYILILLVGILAGWLSKTYLGESHGNKNLIAIVKPRPLEKYSIENLSKLRVPKSEIKREDTLKEGKGFTSYLFSMVFDPTLSDPSGKSNKKVTGLLNIPKKEGSFPVIVMFRGYVDQKEYKTGDGTRRAGEFFSENGFITIAPDFPGYGGSDSEGENIFESRFQTYTTALITLASVKSINEWDKENIFIWGHSNGGHIAITSLEITGENYPTVLWAPVSKPFPYSVLYYTDESEDKGKLIRRGLARFEDDYDTELYSPDNYLNRIKAALSIHQGTSDDSVPKSWTDTFTAKLSNLNVKYDYYVYPGADHNLSPLWNVAAERSLNFFKKNLSLTKM